MYHKRLIERKFREYAAHFKVVLILGARQVGKSTLLDHVFPDLKKIVFDPVQDLFGARQDPELFLNTFPTPLILDEIQYAPELLPAIKRRVDLSEKKGQYFLTGSQNLNLLKSVAESMAGRVGILHLDGMTLSELKETVTEPSWLDTYLSQPEKFLLNLPAKDNLPLRLWRGSLPGTLELPDNLIPSYYQSYIQTYVERDVRLLENIRELAEFDRFLSLLGALSGQEVNTSQLGREIGIAPATARRWLDLLSNTYQWLELFPYSGNTIKRLSGKRKGYLRDTGMACYLQRISSFEALLANPLMGPLFEAYVVNAVHRQFVTLSVAPIAYHWRTAAGAEVDLVLERNGNLYPIEIKSKTNLMKHDISGIKAFRNTYSNSKSKVMTALVIYGGNDCYWLDEDVLAFPWTCL